MGHERTSSCSDHIAATGKAGRERAWRLSSSSKAPPKLYLLSYLLCRSLEGLYLSYLSLSGLPGTLEIEEQLK